MLTRDQLKWTEKDDEIVESFMKQVEAGEIEVIPFSDLIPKKNPEKCGHNIVEGVKCHKKIDDGYYCLTCEECGKELTPCKCGEGFAE